MAPEEEGDQGVGKLHRAPRAIRDRAKAGSIFELVLLIVVVTKGGVILVLFIAFGRSVIV